MSLFDKIFGFLRQPSPRTYEGTFKMLNGYTPVFHSRSGGLYESELVRAAINARATHISKLDVKTFGPAKPALQRKLAHGPNEWQTWSQFLYRLSTILDVNNTAFITPVYDEYGEPSGIYTPLPEKCEIVQYGDVPYLRYDFGRGNKAAMELAWCGIMTRMQYRSDFFGETNKALEPTMDLIHIQNEGIQEGVKSAAHFRFMAQASNFSKVADLSQEAARFSSTTFNSPGNSALLLFPNTYTNIKQVDVKPWVVDAEQMAAIKANVFEYFGVNEDVLTNAAYGDKWAAFYEGAIEPFAVQFSEVVTKALFTLREQSTGNYVMASANRIQYMSNADKLAVSSNMLDRGIMSINDVREIWNLPPVEGGDIRIIRGEYYNADGKLIDANNGGNTNAD